MSAVSGPARAGDGRSGLSGAGPLPREKSAEAAQQRTAQEERDEHRLSLGVAEHLLGGEGIQCAIVTAQTGPTSAPQAAAVGPIAPRALATLKPAAASAGPDGADRPYGLG